MRSGGRAWYSAVRGLEVWSYLLSSRMAGTFQRFVTIRALLESQWAYLLILATSQVLAVSQLGLMQNSGLTTYLPTYLAT